MLENQTKPGMFKHLEQYEVPFVLIGGHAVNYHGHIRATEDVDIVFLRTTESEIKLFQALQTIHARWISDELDPHTGYEKEVPISLEFLQNNHLMMLYTDLGYLDVFDFVPGFPNVPTQELFDKAEEFQGTKIVSLEWLKKIKATANRPKDLDDLKNLP
jgi:predicted nucleotidyltransferase